MSLNTDYIIHKQDISLPIPAQSGTSNPPKLGLKKFSVLGKYLGIILILLSSVGLNILLQNNYKQTICLCS